MPDLRARRRAHRRPALRPALHRGGLDRRRHRRPHRRRERDIHSQFVALRTALDAATIVQAVDTGCRLGLIPLALPTPDLASLGDTHITVIALAAAGHTMAETAQVTDLSEREVGALRNAVYGALGVSDPAAAVVVLHALGRLPATHPCARAGCIEANRQTGPEAVRDAVRRGFEQLLRKADTQAAYATAVRRLHAVTSRLDTATRDLQHATDMVAAAEAQAQQALGQAHSVAEALDRLAGAFPLVQDAIRQAREAGRIAAKADERARDLLVAVKEGRQQAEVLGELIGDARLMWMDMGPAVKTLAEHRTTTGPAVPGRVPDDPAFGGRPPIPQECRPWRRWAADGQEG
ncbi:hypothetical protein [Kitasatospora sp. NPDC056184]|uniref:hypothetical protein n=1 Tax=Kitasatospora sp. NPDC056184 TaxID=3345738 RepID=UPI0035DAEC11